MLRKRDKRLDKPRILSLFLNSLINLIKHKPVFKKMFPTVLAMCTCILAGLKTPMCGANDSLTSDLAFTSSNGKITLIFRRKSSGVKDKASFNMTFIAFYEGKWDNLER